MLSQPSASYTQQLGPATASALPQIPLQNTPQVPATFHEIPAIPSALLPELPQPDPAPAQQAVPEFQQYSPIYSQPAGEVILDPARSAGYPQTASQPFNIASGSGDVGKRYGVAINRNTIQLDDGFKHDFEKKKKEYPPFSEIIATGKFFAAVDILWIEPNFQGNTAFSTDTGDFGQSVAFDFDSDFQPRVKLGFESQYGPGVEFSYFNLNSNSELASFTSSPGITSQSSVWVSGRNEFSRLLSSNPGETLTTQHGIDLDSATISFFKDLKFPISRVAGNFGFQYVSIAQRLDANVTDASGTIQDSLVTNTDMRAWGPRAIIEYYRPIGHTPLELSTSFGGSLLFGQRDQVVQNSQTGLLNRTGADEFITLLDFAVTLQYVKNVGENRNVYGRLGFINQTWIGGGTGTDPQGDFGIRGFTFGIGYNR